MHGSTELPELHEWKCTQNMRSPVYLHIHFHTSLKFTADWMTKCAVHRHAHLPTPAQVKNVHTTLSTAKEYRTVCVCVRCYKCVITSCLPAGQQLSTASESWRLFRSHNAHTHTHTQSLHCLPHTVWHVRQLSLTLNHNHVISMW